MRSHQEKVRLAASITFDRFGQKAQKEISIRINELKQHREHDEAQFWHLVGEELPNFR
jgi:hypothetical protein